MGLTWKEEKDPCCHLISSSQTCKVKLSYCHSDGVLDSMHRSKEVPQVRAENEVEKAAERAKYNDKFHSKSSKANEA